MNHCNIKKARISDPKKSKKKRFNDCPEPKHGKNDTHSESLQGKRLIKTESPHTKSPDIG